MTHRKMIAGLAGMALAVGGTGVALAASGAAAPRSVTVAQSDGFKVVPNQYVKDMLRFNKDVYTVKSGSTLHIVNMAADEGPHTFTVVARKDEPRTLTQLFSCKICQ